VVEWQRLLTSRSTLSQSDVKYKQELWEGGSRIGGKALSICYTEKISKFGRRHTIAQCLGDEGLVKTKLFNYICKKIKGKAFYMFK
jgi:hypothetical protein